MVSFSSEQLTGQKFTTVGVTQSAILQRTKLKTLLDKVDKLLGYSSDSPEKRWSVDSQFDQCYVMSRLTITIRI